MNNRRIAAACLQRARTRGWLPPSGRKAWIGIDVDTREVRQDAWHAAISCGGSSLASATTFPDIRLMLFEAPTGWDSRSRYACERMRAHWITDQCPFRRRSDDGIRSAAHPPAPGLSPPDGRCHMRPRLLHTGVRCKLPRCPSRWRRTTLCTSKAAILEREVRYS